VLDGRRQEEPAACLEVDFLTRDDEARAPYKEDDPLVMILPKVERRLEGAAEDLLDHDASQQEQPFDGLAGRRRRSAVAETAARPSFSHLRGGS
jgi:hypothetical protein